MRCGICGLPITKKFDLVNMMGKTFPVHKHCNPINKDYNK